MSSTAELRAAERLADLVADLERRLRQLERAPRLSSASIEGEPLDVFDDAGNLRQTFGLQVDGTYTTTDVNGPVPPTPTGSSANAGVESVSVGWAGGATVLPLPADFTRVAVHVSKVDGFTPTEATELAAFNSPVGGLVSIPADAGVTHYVRLVMVTTSQTWSAPTAQVAVTPVAPGGGNSLTPFHQDDPPWAEDDPTHAADDGVLWYESDAGNLPHIWNGTTLTWDPLQLGLAALATEVTAGALGAFTTYTGTDDPADPLLFPDNTVSDGDWWLHGPQTINGVPNRHLLKRRTAGAWVVVDDPNVQAALEAATEAGSLADQKVRIFIEPPAAGAPLRPLSDPQPPDNLDVDDVWLDSSHGFTQYHWNGAAWTLMLIDSAALAPGASPPPVVPTATATPEPVGGVAAIYVRIPPVLNDSPFEVDVYIGTSDTMLLDASTFHGSATGSLYPIESLPDGTPLDPNATYYIVLRTRNPAGNGPQSIAVPATMRPVGVDEEAFGLLFAGQLTVARLTGDVFNLGAGDVNQIEAVDPTGARVGMSSLAGFYLYGTPQVTGQQGPTLVTFPFSGKPFISGDFEATSLTTVDGATLNGVTEVAPGGSLVLGGQVQPPRSLPQVSYDWHTVQHTGGVLGATGWTYAGLSKGHDGYWYSVGNIKGSTSVVDKFHDTTGAFARVTNLPSGYTYTGGIVYGGGWYFLLAQQVSSGGWYIETRDTNFALQGARVPLVADTVPDFTPCIGWDHINGRLLIGKVTTVAGQVTVYSYTVNAAGGIVLMSIERLTTPVGYSYPYDLGYVARVATEYGDRYVFRRIGTGASDGVQNFQVFTAAGAVRQGAEEWLTANSAQARGGWWDGTRFWSVDGTGRRCRYETGRAMWTSGPDTREIEFAWWSGTRSVTATRTSASAVLTSAGLFIPGDVGKAITGTGIPAGATVLSYQSPSQVTLSTPASSGGTAAVTITRPAYETTPSLVASLIWPKRSRLSVTVPAVPTGAWGDANAIGARIYMRNASPDPFVRQTTIVTPVTAWSMDSTVAAETGAPKSSNTYPAATPSDFKSTTGGVQITSSGDGSVGTAGLLADIRARKSYVGEIILWPSNTIPVGYLLCNGQAVSRLLYVDLWNLIGTLFGIGDGSTSFNVPDFAGGFPMGALNLLTGAGALGYSNLAGIGDVLTVAGQTARYDRTNHDHNHAGQGSLQTALSFGGRNNAPTGGTQTVIGNIEGFQNGPVTKLITGSTANALNQRHGLTAVNFLIATGKAA